MKTSSSAKASGTTQLFLRVSGQQSGAHAAVRDVGLRRRRCSRSSKDPEIVKSIILRKEMDGELRATEIRHHPELPSLEGGAGEGGGCDFPKSCSMDSHNAVARSAAVPRSATGKLHLWSIRVAMYKDVTACTAMGLGFSSVCCSCSCCSSGSSSK